MQKLIGLIRDGASLKCYNLILFFVDKKKTLDNVLIMIFQMQTMQPWDQVQTTVFFFLQLLSYIGRISNIFQKNFQFFNNVYATHFQCLGIILQNVVICKYIVFFTRCLSFQATLIYMLSIFLNISFYTTLIYILFIFLDNTYLHMFIFLNNTYLHIVYIFRQHSLM